MTFVKRRIDQICSLSNLSLCVVVPSSLLSNSEVWNQVVFPIVFYLKQNIVTEATNIEVDLKEK